MPRFLGRSNAADVPAPALLLTTILIQVVLVVTLFSEDAFNFALDLTSALSLIPFLLAAGYALKLAVTKETYDDEPATAGGASWSSGCSPRSTRSSCSSPPARSSSWSRSSSTPRRRSCS